MVKPRARAHVQGRAKSKCPHTGQGPSLNPMVKICNLSAKLHVDHGNFLHIQHFMMA